MSLNLQPVIALVPARGGSKGITRKNLLQVGGRSLVEITLAAALGAKHIDRVYLSSDDMEICSIGKAMSVEVIIRPADLASDSATANDVVKNFIEKISDDYTMLDPYVVYLQPTSPARSSRHIDQAFIEMASMNEHTLVSVVEVNQSPYKSFVLTDGRLQSLFEETLSNFNRQDLPKVYIPNGAIYVFRISDFIKRGGFPSNGSIPFVMSEADSIDIDSPEDIRRVESKLGELNG